MSFDAVQDIKKAIRRAANHIVILSQKVIHTILRNMCTENRRFRDIRRH